MRRPLIQTWHLPCRYHSSFSLGKFSKIPRPTQPSITVQFDGQTVHTLSKSTRQVKPDSFRPVTLWSIPSLFFRHSRRFTSTKSSSPTPQTFSARMRKLSREYGWSALGVYLFLSALDFPFCFAAVRLLGVERIGHYEHVVVESAKNAVGPLWGRKASNSEPPESGHVAITTGFETTALDHGITPPENKVTGEGASIWTQLALAYAVHKSLIFFRVPLTAAVTPHVVKTLRRWGWNIGRQKPKG
ncbi:DUF1279 domain-containing protein [Ophidiomyces ophidiicola]|uniref:DUF1279 domain-containing protein n=1 Tax=Ophidiomyces ophidiicola TaxID=1387563 RepID=A0ACB8V101_9EURO|nr:DUF1279 domain-containing protein [Ophidiomyces ophidiicola]KAI1910950.1 DUF1279 domain-containing protein [Ophidiomyces ophidiicola]KAI1924053.1 DUF1279 domain-containing protein [Ophidiomyces ophidiicola]KAI1927795.1 DUF1279 domain-containing protein [Ophidiomyces ophidiicola]KAI1931783.1 DUF1279 domain-containing protein [Ophidiomyces ophidiicola]KAI1941556.1 DUF1279 domain-containing protein [Ophidiomyces ophidiicola]